MDIQEIFAAKLVNALYVDAMVLADEARSYFELDDDPDVLALSPAARIDMSCESLRVTTRLMHSIAWLLNQKAYFAGEISQQQLRGNGRALGKSSPSDPEIVKSLPPSAQILIYASEKLYARLARLEESLEQDHLTTARSVDNGAPVVHQIHERLLAEMAR